MSWMTTQNFLLTQAIVTTLMTGVIWVVQVVLYPLFAPYAQKGEFSELEKLHSYYTPKITVVVLPLMFLELALSLGGVITWASHLELFLLLPVLAAWAATFFISVPCHNAIASNSEAQLKREAVSRLITTNWLRTFLWSGRAVALWWLVYNAL